MDLYKKMGDALRDLFKDLFRHDMRAVVEAKMNEILKTAALIGGPLAKEAEELAKDIQHYLKDPTDPKRIAILKKHAMRLQQETKEL
jgi:hypothetical protein